MQLGFFMNVAVLISVYRCGLALSSCPPASDDAVALVQATLSVHRGGSTPKQLLKYQADDNESQGGPIILKNAPLRTWGGIQEECSDSCLAPQPNATSSYLDLNVTNELPSGVEIKHAGWTRDMYNKGLGIFATRSFEKGEEIGSAHAKVVPCSKYTTDTPVGKYEIVCPIHFYRLSECSADNKKTDEATGYPLHSVFASWLSFLNGQKQDTDETYHMLAQNSSHNSHMKTSVKKTEKNTSQQEESAERVGKISKLGLESNKEHRARPNVEFGESTCFRSPRQEKWRTC
jgi:hypothetical protein